MNIFFLIKLYSSRNFGPLLKETGVMHLNQLKGLVYVSMFAEVRQYFQTAQTVTCLLI